MARPSKIEVCAINIRISADRNRDYAALISDIYENKIAAKVYGDSFLAITQFDPDSGMGVFSKYSEIDIDGDWFDVEDFGPADPEKIEEVSIPESLRPNLSAFYFKLDAENHVICFETYSESKALSARSVEKYFRMALLNNVIIEKFGRVEVDIIKSYGEVERIFGLSNLKELRIIIRRPNPDDISGDLAAQIEERLREQNGEEYEEVLRSKDKDGLSPNERTKKLAIVGAENGEVLAKNISNGIQVDYSTAESPEKISETYNKEKTTTKIAFKKLADDMFSLIKRRRSEIRGM